jgi:hypothetical protein
MLSLRAGQNSGSRKFVRWQTNPGFIQCHDLEAVCESGATFLGAFPASPEDLLPKISLTCDFDGFGILATPH